MNPTARWLSIRRWCCRVILGADFFNPDASRQIDLLTLEIERLKEELNKRDMT